MPRWVTLAVLLTVAVPHADELSTADRPPVIDVIVTDANGRAVTTLTPSDFLISEQGQSRSVAAARFVRGDERIIAIFLDEFHTASGDAAGRVRDALAHAVRTRLAPADRVVVFKPLDSILAITTTSDHEAAARAIETFEARKGDYAARTAFERNYIAGAPARIEAARTQIAVSALNALATHLATLGDSRKTLVVVADGLGRRFRTRGGETLPTLETVQRAADTAHVSVYAVQANNPSEDPASVDARDALRALAAETGGRSIAAGDDLDRALGAMLSDADGYYEVTLRPAGPADGKFHPVEVRVVPKAMTVRARRGYFAVSPEQLRAATAAIAPPARLAAGPPRRTSPLIRVWFGQARGDGNATKVSFVWEPAPIVPVARGLGRPARVALNVTAQDGTPVFDGLVLPSGTGASLGAADQSQASFEMPPGRLLVQMKIQDAGSRVLDTDVRDLIVAGFTGPVTIGSAEVFRARSAREYRALAGDPNAAPVASRQFSRAERLLIRVPVYAAAAPPPAVSARLVSRFGSALRDLDVARADGDAYQIDLPLAGLAAGEYSVELTASAGSGAVKENVPIRVTP